MTSQEPNGETRLYFTVGDPIAQVKSPAKLSQILFERGENALLLPAHVKPQDFPDFVRQMGKMENCGGFCITIPHKQAALTACDVVTERARFIGAVNIMHKRPDGTWSGDNLDGFGCIGGIEAAGFSVEGKKALLVGGGGAGSAIAFELLQRGVSSLAIFDADAARLQGLIRRLKDRFGDIVSAGSSDPTGYDLIVNATPMGMKPTDPLPVETDKLKSSQFVADVITKPAVSPLLERARAIGCNTMAGLSMVEAQGEQLTDWMSGKGDAASLK